MAKYKEGWNIKNVRRRNMMCVKRNSLVFKANSLDIVEQFKTKAFIGWVFGRREIECSHSTIEYRGRCTELIVPPFTWNRHSPAEKGKCLPFSGLLVEQAGQQETVVAWARILPRFRGIHKLLLDRALSAT